MHLSRLPLLGVAATLAAACSDGPAPFQPDPPSPDPDPDPPVTLVVQEQASGPLTLGLGVQVNPAAAVQVEYWSDGETRYRVFSPSGTRHDLTLTRLFGDTEYQYEVGVDFDDPSLAADPVEDTFRTDSLPPALAAVSIASTGASSSPLTMLELREPTFEGFAAVDSIGRIVWYHATAGGSWGWTKRANGNFVFLDTRDGLTELTPAGEVVATLPSAQGELIHHDVIATPQNTLYFMSRHPQNVDSRRWVGEIIWEWDPDAGSLVERWNAFDFLTPAADTTERSTTGDWIHGNSLNIAPNGNVLLSSPWLNQVIAITSDFSALAWRLGGKNATILTDSAGTFDFQHTAAQLSEDRVLVFDNRGGTDGTITYSRALELEVDFASDSAREVWSFRAPNDNYASIISGARRMANGNTMVTFGTENGFRGSRGPVEVYEVAPDGTIVWNLVVGGPSLMYRATPFDRIGEEVVVSP